MDAMRSSSQHINDNILGIYYIRWSNKKKELNWYTNLVMYSMCRLMYEYHNHQKLENKWININLNCVLTSILTFLIKFLTNIEYIKTADKYIFLPAYIFFFFKKNAHMWDIHSTHYSYKRLHNGSIFKTFIYLKFVMVSLIYFHFKTWWWIRRADFFPLWLETQKKDSRWLICGFIFSFLLIFFLRCRHNFFFYAFSPKKKAFY